MKKLQVSLLCTCMAALAGLLCACDGSKPAVVQSIDVSTTTVTLAPEGGTATVTVTSPLAWEIGSTVSWAQVSPQKGDAGTATVTFTAEKNETGETRTGSAIISSGTLAAVTITITQDSVEKPSTPDPSITVDVKDVELLAEGGSATVSITSNVAWTLSASDAWIQVSPDKGESGTVSVTISANKNDSGADRTGTITLKADSLDPLTISVFQKAFEEPETDEPVNSNGSINDWADGGENTYNRD